MLYLTKAPPARSPSLRLAAPKQRAAAKAAPPAAKPAAKRALLDAVGADGLIPRSTPTKRATTKTAAAPKAPAPLPAPRQPPTKVAIKFPKLPTQPHAARYEGPNELQAQLAQYRRFISVARMVGEARKLTSDERHQIEVARARIAEIKALGWSAVR